MRKIALGLSLCCLLALLCGCQALDALQVEGEKTASVPDLRQLTPLEAAAKPIQAESTAAEAGAYQVDLWLDGTKNMGGVNGVEGTMYPHSGTRYREGGFHYHYGAQVGWYEDVLRELLLSADGHKLRVLRFGPEWASDSLLREGGLIGEAAGEDMLRSLRRDLMTYALQPELSLASQMSGDVMTGGFYAPGGSALGRVASLIAEGETGLENPAQAQALASTALLWRQKLTEGGSVASEAMLRRSKNETESPLLSALDTMDLAHLNVLVFDPASLRRLTMLGSDGSSVSVLQELLTRRGVFGAGKGVGLMAFRLDYMGQMDSFGPAELALPLIWGKTLPKSTQGQYYVGCMPRIALLMAVGEPAQVRDYLDTLCSRLDKSEALKGERGPRQEELSYAENGQTVRQRPFTFAYWRTAIDRPEAGLYTQGSAGARVESGGGVAEDVAGLPMIRLEPTVQGTYEPSALILTLPVEAPQNGVTLTASSLTNRAAHVLTSLVLEETRPIVGGATLGGEQVLALRDKEYVFRRIDEPFMQNEEKSPFTLGRLELRDGRLTAVIDVDGAKLCPGYYRVQVEADVRGESMAWPTVDWIDGEESLDAKITTELENSWEAFAALAYEQQISRRSVDLRVHHAWGEADGKDYFGMPVPDCPPVYRAVQLGELTRQLRAAASAQTSPYLRFVVDVFVDNQMSEPKGETK